MHTHMLLASNVQANLTTEYRDTHTRCYLINMCAVYRGILTYTTYTTMIDELKELRRINCDLYEQNMDLRNKLWNLQKRIDITVTKLADTCRRNSKPKSKETDEQWGQRVLANVLLRLEKLTNHHYN